MKARGGRVQEEGGRTGPGGGNGETDGRGERKEWGEEVGRGGVPAGRDLSESRPTACEGGVCLLGADWRNGENPTDSPLQKRPETLPREGGGRQMERRAGI